MIFVSELVVSNIVTCDVPLGIYDVSDNLKTVQILSLLPPAKIVLKVLQRNCWWKQNLVYSSKDNLFQQVIRSDANMALCSQNWNPYSKKWREIQNINFNRVWLYRLINISWFREPMLFNFASNKTALINVFWEPEIINLGKLIFAALKDLTIYLEHEDWQEVDIDGEIVTFTQS